MSQDKTARRRVDEKSETRSHKGRRVGGSKEEAGRRSEVKSAAPVSP